MNLASASPQPTRETPRVGHPVSWWFRGKSLAGPAPDPPFHSPRKQQVPLLRRSSLSRWSAAVGM